MSLKLKEYILTGSYVDSNGKEYQKGDKIKLSDSDLRFFTNKILDPNKILHAPDEVDHIMKKMKKLQTELEAVEIENKLLKKQLQDLANKSFKNK